MLKKSGEQVKVNEHTKLDDLLDSEYNVTF